MNDHKQFLKSEPKKSAKQTRLQCPSILVILYPDTMFRRSLDWEKVSAFKVIKNKKFLEQIEHFNSVQVASDERVEAEGKSLGSPVTVVGVKSDWVLYRKLVPKCPRKHFMWSLKNCRYILAAVSHSFRVYL